MVEKIPIPWKKCGKCVHFRRDTDNSTTPLEVSVPLTGVCNASYFIRNTDEHIYLEAFTSETSACFATDDDGFDLFSKTKKS